MEHSSSFRKKIITIAGRPGSGKSTTAKLVAFKLGFQHFSSGDLFRALGKEQGIDVLSANQAAGVTEKLDELVDNKLRLIGRSEDKIVIDSRIAWHWIPNSFKVFLDLDFETAAQRILNEENHDRLNSEDIHQDFTKYAEALRYRSEMELARYKQLYGINPFDTGNYDLVINTAECGLEQVVDRIIDGFEAWSKQTASTLDI